MGEIILWGCPTELTGFLGRNGRWTCSGLSVVLGYG